MVSVIICFYERVRHLRCCLDSLRFSRQDFDEVIIIDDGSPMHIVADAKRLIAGYDFPIRYVWQENRGFRAAAARNKGVRNASGDYLIFFDCDFLILPGTVRAHVDRARRGRFLQISLGSSVRHSSRRRHLRNPAGRSVRRHPGPGTADTASQIQPTHVPDALGVGEPPEAGAWRSPVYLQKGYGNR